MGRVMDDLVIGRPGNNLLTVLNIKDDSSVTIAGPIGSLRFGHSVTVEPSVLGFVVVGDPNADSFTGAAHRVNFEEGSLQVTASFTGAFNGQRAGNTVAVANKLSSSSSIIIGALNSVYVLPSSSSTGSLSSLYTTLISAVSVDSLLVSRLVGAAHDDLLISGQGLVSVVWGSETLPVSLDSSFVLFNTTNSDSLLMAVCICTDKPASHLEINTYVVRHHQARGR
jgi:hypothetical protein